MPKQCARLTGGPRAKVRTQTVCMQSLEDAKLLAAAIEEFGVYVYAEDTGCGGTHGGYFMLIMSSQPLDKRFRDALVQDPPGSSDWSDCPHDVK